jgi:putative two-component system response regulator
MFEENYDILEAENGALALDLIAERHEDIAIVLLDLIMPEVDGYEVMKHLKKEGYLDEMPVVIITADNTTENELQAFDLGASDIIMKPFAPSVVQRRVKNIVDLYLYRLNLEEMVHEQAMEIMESNAVVIDTLSSIIENRSVETGQHNLRIRKYTQLIMDYIIDNCPEYGLDKYKAALIVNASSLHDIGKIVIPDSILNKPGKLTATEFEIMKTHSLKGAELIDKLSKGGNKEYLEYAYDICKYHHEKWDGKGYPEGLAGNEIPIWAQAVSIADCYDALTQDRVYKKAIPPEDALNMIFNGECGKFSDELMDCLRALSDDFIKTTKVYSVFND